eukprot:NODE_721_length_1684_cov_197.914579_g711_i0.p1 GENE.NODE_721_length_1684_cov_197.914579_g711_i0~~NODE_721_length_1684_cov_197.914579_g711_i0.p1  ORF type:complete len:488 (+),score=136.20 NODE_721_length_1684_cov_197.914579_g711_i0:94-1557(+)
MSHGRTTPSGRPRPQPNTNYFIVQCFITFAEQPQNGWILRVDSQATVEDVVHMALTKYNEMLVTSDYDKTALASYSPPSTAPNDYILRVAKGDGTPDRAAPPLERTGLLREQGLLFPFMVVLSLDPNKDVYQMSLTDAFKAQLLARSNKEDKKDPETSSIASSDVPPGPPADPVTGLPSQGELETSAREAYVKTRSRQDDIEGRRRANIQKKEEERLERERQHFESCERREHARREKLAAEKAAEEQRALEQIEENHRLEMARKMDVLVREQKQREMMEAQKKELEKEEQVRRQRHIALEKERQIRFAAKQENERQAKAERAMLRELGRQQRMEENLNYIVAKLHNEISADDQARMEMLQQERIEREAAEREAFEREYVARIEHQQRAKREEQNEQLLQIESRREQWEAEQAARKQAEEDAKAEEIARQKAQWVAGFRKEKEKVKRLKGQRQLHDEETAASAAEEAVRTRRAAGASRLAASSMSVGA